jgi:uracil phosphoribosyltransferase
MRLPARCPWPKETIETPLQPMQAPVLQSGLVLVSVLRAGFPWQTMTLSLLHFPENLPK